MKLFLSSSGLGEHPLALPELVGGDGRAAVIFNARDASGSNRLKFQDAEYAALEELGFVCDELDLREYFDEHEGLAARLRDSDLVWAVGGNTFVLARAMTEAAFGEAIVEELFADRIVYGGYSAGACVTAPDLDGCHLIDAPDAVAEGYSRDVEPSALGWVPWRIVPHWHSLHEEAPLAERAVAYLLEAGLPFQTLRDGQAFVIDGPDHRIA